MWVCVGRNHLLECPVLPGATRPWRDHPCLPGIQLWSLRFCPLVGPSRSFLLLDSFLFPPSPCSPSHPFLTSFFSVCWQIPKVCILPSKSCYFFICSVLLISDSVRSDSGFRLRASCSRHLISPAIPAVLNLPISTAPADAAGSPECPACLPDI